MEKETYLHNYPLMGYGSSWEGMSVHNQFPRIQHWTRSTAFHFETINLVHVMKNLTSISTVRLLGFHVQTHIIWHQNGQHNQRHPTGTNTKPTHKTSNSIHDLQVQIFQRIPRVNAVARSEQRFLELRKIIHSTVIYPKFEWFVIATHVYLYVVDTLAKPLKALRHYPQGPKIIQDTTRNFSLMAYMLVQLHLDPLDTINERSQRFENTKVQAWQRLKHQHWDAWWEPNKRGRTSW